MCGWMGERRRGVFIFPTTTSTGNGEKKKERSLEGFLIVDASVFVLPFLVPLDDD